MNTLYQITKELIDLIKKVRPDILYVIEPQAQLEWVSNFDRNPEIAVYQQSIYLANEGDIRHCVVIDAQTLITIVPELFGEVENPEYNDNIEAIEVLLSPPYISNEEKEVIANLRGIIDFMPKKLDKTLLQKYFVDGLWLKSKEATLRDIINNINTYLK
jgi:hypothetical protein